MKKRYIFFSLIILFLFSACGNGITNEENDSSKSEGITGNEKIELLLAAEGTAMYYAYVAKEKGFFKEEGLDVELVPCNSGAFVVERIGREKAHIGIVAAPSLFYAWNNDIDIQVIYQINSTNLFDFIVSKGSPIKEIRQLKGKTIGVTDDGGAEVQMVQALLTREGLKVDKDVKIKAIGNDGNTILNAFQTGKIAAFSGGVHDLNSLYATDFQSESLLPIDYKTLPSTAIVANGKTIREKPQFAEKISRAIAKGIDFSIKNKTETYEMMRKIYPKEYENEYVGKRLLETFINLSAPINTEKGYGYIYRDSWEKLIELYSIGEDPVITKEINLDHYLNDRFLKKANDFHVHSELGSS